MEKSKILTHLNFAKGFRGGERQTLLLIQELSNRGYQQRLCTRKKSELSERASHIKDLERIKIPKPYLLSLGKIKDSGLIHAHETQGAQFAYLAYLRYGIPYIITRRVIFPVKKIFFNRQMYRSSITTIAISNAVKEELLHVSRDIKCQIIPSSISNFKVDAVNQRILREEFEDKFVIGNIGELEQGKGQYYLIEAAKKLTRKYPDICFLFLGKGKDEDKYRIQAQGYDNLLFKGFVDNVGDYLSILNLFVFPSLHEGLGSILLDVMEKQVPIIATNVGGIPEIIKNNENGVLINPMSTSEIEEEIERLYKDREFSRRIAQKAYLDSKKYTVEKMTDKYIELYKL